MMKPYFTPMAAVSWACLFIIYGTVAFLFYTFVDDKPYLSYPVLPIHVEHKNIYSGEAIELHVTRCNNSGSFEVEWMTEPFNVLARLPTSKVK